MLASSNGRDTAGGGYAADMGDGRAEGGEAKGAGAPGSRGVVLLSRPFTAATVTQMRHLLAAEVAAAGLVGEAGDDYVLAVHELVTNVVRHGGGAGHLSLHLRADVLVAEVTDHGVSAGDLSVGLPAVDVPGGRGLWLAQELTGSLILTTGRSGVTASVSACLTPPPGDSTPGGDRVVDISFDEG